MISSFRPRRKWRGLERLSKSKDFKVSKESVVTFNVLTNKIDSCVVIFQTSFFIVLLIDNKSLINWAQSKSWRFILSFSSVILIDLAFYYIVEFCCDTKKKCNCHLEVITLKLTLNNLCSRIGVYVTHMSNIIYVFSKETYHNLVYTFLKNLIILLIAYSDCCWKRLRLF